MAERGAVAVVPDSERCVALCPEGLSEAPEAAGRRCELAAGHADAHEVSLDPAGSLCWLDDE